MLTKTFRVATWLFLAHLARGGTVPRTTSSDYSGGLLPRTNPACTVKSPPPHNTVCGTKGYLRKPKMQLTGSSKVSEVSTCRGFCNGRSRSPDPLSACTTFAYQASTGLCNLYNYTLSELKFKGKPSSSVEYYSMGCFDCPDQCPNPAQTNIADNGGFEFSDRLIGPWSTTIGGARVVSPGHNSAHALYTNRGLQIKQFHDICNTITYSFSVDVMITASPGDYSSGELYLVFGQLSVHLRADNPNDNITSFTYGSWHTFRGTSRGPTNDYTGMQPTEISLSWFVTVSSGFEIHIDNFVVKPTNGVYQTVGSDLLRNGGFESGSIAPWQLTNVYQVYGVYGRGEVKSPGLTPGSHHYFSYNEYEVEKSGYVTYCSGPSSSYSCESGSSYYGGNDYGGFVLSQAFSAVPGTTYLLSFTYLARNINTLYIYVGCGTGTTWTLLAEPLDYGYGSGGFYYNDAPTTDGKLREFSRVFQAFKRKCHLYMTFSARGYYDKQVDLVQLDNISILALADGQSL